MPPSSFIEKNVVEFATNNIQEINLNEILQQSLQRLQKTNSNPVVRCEDLPFIEADRNSIKKVFDTLINTIGTHTPTGTHLFLHVACEESKIKTVSSKDYKRYRIDFRTNISTTKEWQAANNSILNDCRALLAQCGAVFIVNEIKNTGCLFSIILLGKLYA